ncbi:MAG TPA: 2-aminoethylphosphonate--pyruvate transaminase [Azoarcus taiwanensis]|nr:2-aminoethylphosphonate--pyruvate transaminase [Azoarcus taiwanensis]
MSRTGIEPPRLGEPWLLTPGPLSTAYEVKVAMLRDWGSWDDDFRAMTYELRTRLVRMLGDGYEAYTCVPMQGSGSFAVESMLGTLVPRGGRALVLANGAYGKRAAETLRIMGRSHVVLDKGDFLPPRGYEVARMLADDPAITHVLVVHCETSSGVLNPLEEIADAVAHAGCRLLIDAMSSFGAIPIPPGRIAFDALVSSANKCIEGVPGFGFLLVRQDALLRCEGNAHSLSLDAYAQWATLEKTGQWRFTPPTHAVAAFLEALRLHEAEGGVEGRGARYRANRDALVSGMRGLGFETLLDTRWLSPIITTFFCPADPHFVFDRFYALMKRRGFIIYPGKLTEVDSFRLGCIGQVDVPVMNRLLEAVVDTLHDLGVRNPAPPAAAITKRALLDETEVAA